MHNTAQTHMDLFLSVAVWHEDVPTDALQTHTNLENSPRGEMRLIRGPLKFIFL